MAQVPGRASTDRVLRVYVDHDNTERPHCAPGRCPPVATQPGRGVRFLAGGGGNRVGLAGCVGGPRLRSALVPLTAIVVHVMRPGRRADELLAAVAKHLGRGTQIPDERGHVRILLEESEGAAWQRIHDALDAAGDDWHEHLHVNPRPG